MFGGLRASGGLRSFGNSGRRHDCGSCCFTLSTVAQKEYVLSLLDRCNASVGVADVDLFVDVVVDCIEQEKLRWMTREKLVRT